MSTFLEISGALLWLNLGGLGLWLGAQEVARRFRLWRCNRQGPPPIGVVVRVNPRTLLWRVK